MPSCCHRYMLVAVLAAPWLAQAIPPAIELADSHLRVRLSAATGQVEQVADVEGTVFLCRGEDLYDLDGTSGREGLDRARCTRHRAGEAVFEGENPALGLLLTKQYRLDAGILTKTVSYRRSASGARLLRVASQSTLPPELRHDGCFYVPTDDGYKVTTVPYLRAAEIKEPLPWTVSTGALAFYCPARDRVLTHYRHRLNGGCVYGEVHPSVESRFLADGAVAALGLGFVDSQQALTIESRYVLIPGDPRDWHRHMLAQAPAAASRDRPVPSWFRKARMFLSDSGGCGRDLMRDPDRVVADVASFLKLLREDEQLLVFFNHWTTMGDLPSSGSVRYYTYTDAGYSEPVPVARLKENLDRVKALSPRVKTGGYALFVPMETTRPYDAHRDWLVHNRDGQIEFGGDGTMLGGVPDFSSGYRDYLLEQLRGYLRELGFAWIHVDCGPFEAVNWRTNTVVQSAEVGRFYGQLKDLFQAEDAAVVQNVAWTPTVWADGSYMECQQPDRWEKRDWRILAVPGYLAALYRTQRPGVWVNLCYGTRGMYGLRNAHSGLRGWIRGSLTWWRDVAQSLAQDRVVDELLDTRLSDCRVSPSWWRLETDRLEAETLEHGAALLIPLILHGSAPAVETLTLPTAGRWFKGDRMVFGFDFRLPLPEPLDAFAPVPWSAGAMELLSFTVAAAPPAPYTHRLQIEPRRNYYHVVTQTPAWVYAYNGQRPAFLLPENQGVTVRGTVRAGAGRYDLQVSSEPETAQLLAYVLPHWAGVQVKRDGKAVSTTAVDVCGQRCVLVDVAKGESTLRLADSATSQQPAPSGSAYANPVTAVWPAAAERLFYRNLGHRAFAEDTRSCLELRELAPGGGTVEFHLAGKEAAGGFALAIKGQNTGSTLTVTQTAGQPWTWSRCDDFTGWRRFEIYREQMKPAVADRVWDRTTYLSLAVATTRGTTVTVADVHLLPARPDDIPEKVVAKRRLAIYRAAAAPAVDGQDRDACWHEAQPVTEFVKYAQDRPAEAKTQVRACYDAANLYVFFDCPEPITALSSARVPETQVWSSDHAHLFVDPYRDTMRFFEIGVDTAGTVADIRNDASGADIKWNGTYEVRTALNYNVSWTAELRIPFATLGRAPQDGDVWGVTFARVDNVKEFSVWTQGEWSDPSGFGELAFAGVSAGTAPAPRPVVARREDGLRLACSFDETLAPEVAAGSVTPRPAGIPEYTAGLKGKALVTRHSQGVSYPLAGHFSLAAGTLKLWVMPLDWQGSDPLFHHFARILGPPADQGQGKPFDLVLYRFCEFPSVMAFGLGGELVADRSLRSPMDDTWRPGRWHQLVFAWDTDGAALYVDGRGERRRYLTGAPTVLASDWLILGGPYFVENETATAIDEFGLYDRALSAEEVERLYRLESAQATPAPR